MRFIFTLITLACVAVGSFWVWSNYPETRTWLNEVLNTGKFQTLEVRYSAESIMENHRRELLQDNDHAYLEPNLKFYPYLLLEVKYNKTHDRTGEGIILWSLVDGEMVVNTNSWEKTHGFNDCINAGADRNEFKIINALVTRGGALDREGLIRSLSVEDALLDVWIDSCRKKNLVVQNGNLFRLHLQNPKLQVTPETKLDIWLVTKPAKYANRVSRRYRAAQIERVAKAAFGTEFAVRKRTEIFLPVYSIVVQNPDGSQMTTYWNALNGKRINQPFLIE